MSGRVQVWEREHLGRGCKWVQRPRGKAEASGQGFRALLFWLWGTAVAS